MEIKTRIRELLRAADEIVDYDTAGEKAFYVLKELAAGHEDRVSCRELGRYLPLAEIRKGQLINLTGESIYLKVTGDYFPDLIEENGIYLISEKMADDLRARIALRNSLHNLVILAAEGGKRPEIYYLLIPEEVDCIVRESARYDKQGALIFLELDETRAGAPAIFKVKGFPHLISRVKVDRNGAAGVECVRIENYFDYEGERDRLYQERQSGRRLEEVTESYETAAGATGNINDIYSLQRLLNRGELRDEIRQGLQSVFAAYPGRRVPVELPADGFLALFWTWESGWVRLSGEIGDYFEGNGFRLTRLEAVRPFIAGLPPDLAGLAQRVCVETILYLVCVESRLLDKYPAVTGQGRFRLYMQETGCQRLNPPLVYDRKGGLQLQAEAALDFRRVSLCGADLREVDFGGKSFAGLTIEGSDLRRTRLQGCTLSGTVFINCNLTGTDFRGSNLRGARFDGCGLDRTNFEGADLQEAVFRGSGLRQCRFIRSNLTAVQFAGQWLEACIFQKSKLGSAVFEIDEVQQDNVFRLCDLKKARFQGKTAETTLVNWEFRNCDLTEAQFEVTAVMDSVFLKSKLNATDFSGCERISGCDLRYCSCFKLNLEGVWVEGCDLRYLNLSQLKEKAGAYFYDNYLLGANLSGHDFSGPGYFSNMLREADLSDANLEGLDLRGSDLQGAALNGARLREAVFHSRQLEDIRLSTRQRGEIRISAEDDASNEEEDHFEQVT